MQHMMVPFQHRYYDTEYDTDVDIAEKKETLDEGRKQEWLKSHFKSREGSMMGKEEDEDERMIYYSNIIDISDSNYTDLK